MPELLLPAPPASHLVLQRSPLRLSDRQVFAVPTGKTVAELLAIAGLSPAASAVVFVDDLSVPRERWQELVPHAGAAIAVCLVPEGGNGESGGKTAIRIIAAIIIIVVSIILLQPEGVAFGASLGLGSTAWTIAVVLAGAAANLALNALMPPPVPEAGQQPDSRGQNFINSTRNEIRRFQAVPRPYGTIRFAPPLATLPYTVWKSGKAHFRQLFCCYGPNDLEGLKIGTNPLFKDGTPLVYTGKMTADSGHFESVTLELRKGFDTDDPITLIDHEVHEEGLQIKLDGKPSGTGVAWMDQHEQIRTTLPDTEEISVECSWPGGVSKRKDDGGSENWTVEVRVRYRAVGTLPWLDTIDDDGSKQGDIRITANSTGFERRGHTWSVTKGQYEVGVVRRTTRAGSDQVTDTTYWSKLTSHRKAPPFTMTGLTLIALDIKATGQLSGYVDELTVIFKSWLLRWNGAAWVLALTGNHASVYLDVLTSRANKLAIAPADQAAKIDFEALQAWSDSIETEKRSFCGVFDTDGTVFQRLQQICSSARASFGKADMKYSVVRDLEQTVPIGGTFSPRNSWGFHEHGTYEEVPHAIKVRFPNPALDFKIDEQYVYADGYSKAGGGGTTAATLFETLDYPFATTGSEVWRDTRYHLAVLRERPALYDRMLDIAFLRARRGDLIACADDVIAVGLASGRVKTVTTVNPDGTGNVLSIVLDQVCTMEALKSYGVRITKSDLSSVVLAINTVAGDQTTLTFTTPISLAASKPEVKDLILFGEAGSEAGLYMVKEILPGPEFTAKIVYVDKAPAVYVADASSVARPDWAKDLVFGDVTPNTRTPTDTVIEAPKIDSISGKRETPPATTDTGELSLKPKYPVASPPPVTYTRPAIKVKPSRKHRKHGK